MTFQAREPIVHRAVVQQNQPQPIQNQYQQHYPITGRAHHGTALMAMSPAGPSIANSSPQPPGLESYPLGVGVTFHKVPLARPPTQYVRPVSEMGTPQPHAGAFTSNPVASKDNANAPVLFGGAVDSGPVFNEDSPEL